MNTRTLSSIEQRTLATYEASAARWSAERADSSFWALEAAHLQTLQSTGRLLDVGCGAGRDAQLWDASYQVTGIDISPALLALARKHCPQAEFVVASAYDLPFADDHFAAVWAVASLLHLPRSRLSTALAEIRRVLQPNGSAFFALKRGRGEEFIRSELGERFFTYYDPDQLCARLEKAHLPVIEMRERTVGGSDWICCWCH